MFILRADWPEAFEALQDANIEAELTFPHWLGKAYGGEDRKLFVDLIFSGGNGVAEVDEVWFASAQEGYVLGIPVRFCPPEEMIWSKAFVMERERFDGADVIHLTHALRDHLDWPHLINRFGHHWRVLLAHLILLGYVYPGEQVPRLVLEDLLQGLDLERPRTEERLCRGTLLSREQYLVDIESWNYTDARAVPLGKLTSREITDWTDVIEET